MSSLELSLLIDPPYRREFRAGWFRKVVAHVLDVQGISYPTEVGVLITGDDRVAELNRRYRGMEGTTDVLSFSMDGEPVTDLTDIYDRLEAARREERSVRFVFKRLDFEDHHIFGFIQREFEVADLEFMRPMLEQEPAQVAKID
ncbi:MAG: rRNA maturation RNAse YbeY [Chloroflexi bacterium]|nr:rRNA maturation RNAse YbeY [Chloroflexota bacterium]